MYSKNKAEKGYRDFLADLKNGDIPPFILMYGKEQFLVDWAVKALVDRYVNEATKVMDHQALDEEADADTLMSSLAILPLMSERRVITVKNFQPAGAAKPKGFSSDDLDHLADYISEPHEGLLCVFTSVETDGRSKFVKAVKKYGKIYEFDSLSYNELTSFAAKRLHAAGLKIGKQEMDLLIRDTGYDNKESEYTLYNFDNDIKKIIASCEGTYVTASDIESNVIGDNDTFIFDLLDGISGNDKKRAFEILDNRLTKDQYEAMSLTGAICSQLEIMLEVKEFSVRNGMSSYDINRRTGLNEFRVRKALGYADRYSEKKLRSMLEGIYDVNKNIITGLMEPRLALEMFVAEI